MRFAEPDLLWLLLMIPLLALAIGLASRYRRKALERFAGGAAHLDRFSGEVSSHRRVVRALLWLLAAAAIIVAASRPQWGTRLEPITRRGVDVVVVLDTSLSMAAEDVPPSRLGQALHAASSLLRQLAGNRVSLVTFAGKATLLCPLTLDHAAARLFLDSVDVESVPVPGTALADALRVAARALGGSEGGFGGRSRAVVIFSDGEDHEGQVDDALASLKKVGATVYTVGCGTSRGAPIPLRDPERRVTGYKKDREGRVVTTRLDESVLEKLALETDGRHYRATPSEVEIEEIARAMASMDAQEFGTLLRVLYEERYQIPLGLALAALLVEVALADRRRRAPIPEPTTLEARS